MTSHNTILVGVDWTAGSQHALEWTAAMARHTDSAVELVHAASPWVGIEMALPPFDYDLYRKTVEDAMAEWEEKLAGVEHHVRTGEDEAAHVILATAADVAPDLLVLGSHGAGRWAPHLLGSVVSKVLHTASEPVAVVPRSAPFEPAGRRVVVGVDGSSSSLRALRWAASWAGELGSDVYAVCAYPGDLYQERPRLGDPDGPHPESDALTALRGLTTQVEVESGTSIASDVLIGHPGVRLPDLAGDEFALVVGSTGHGEAHSIAFGSTCRRAVTRSTCTTIVVP